VVLEAFDLARRLRDERLLAAGTQVLLLDVGPGLPPLRIVGRDGALGFGSRTTNAEDVTTGIEQGVREIPLVGRGVRERGSELRPAEVERAGFRALSQALKADLRHQIAVRVPHSGACSGSTESRLKNHWVLSLPRFERGRQRQP
jgi:hypothetical protein